MNLYWIIVLGVIAYGIIGSLIVYLCETAPSALDADDPPGLIVFVWLFWPFLLALLLILYIVDFLTNQPDGGEGK